MKHSGFRVGLVATAVVAALSATACGASAQVWTGDGHVVATYDGSKHCNWDSVRFMEIDREQYVFDPGSTIDRHLLAGEPENDAELPSDAVDMGMRRGNASLWLAADGQAAYVVSKDNVQKWPHAFELILCS